MARYLFPLVAVFVLLGAGCGTANAPTAAAPAAQPANAPAAAQPTAAPAAEQPSSAPSAAAATVEMWKFAFDPATVTVKVGQTVTWDNYDGVDHQVVSDSGLFSSQPLPQNGEYSYTFTKAGTYPYHCQIHPTMTGTVIVQ